MQDTVTRMTMQGDELRAIRKAAGKTQGELAAAIGMTGTSVGLMERGAAPIERRTELAVRWACEPQVIIALEGGPLDGASAAAFASSSEAIFVHPNLIGPMCASNALAPEAPRIRYIKSNRATANGSSIFVFS